MQWGSPLQVLTCISVVSPEMHYSFCFTLLAGGGQLQGFPLGLPYILNYSTGQGTNRNVLVFEVQHPNQLSEHQSQLGLRQMTTGRVCGPTGLTLNELWPRLKDVACLLTMEFPIVTIK